MDWLRVIWVVVALVVLIGGRLALEVIVVVGVAIRMVVALVVTLIVAMVVLI